MLNYVIEKEANDSDEDFNVFDQMAQGIAKENIDEKLKDVFGKKLKQVKEQIISEESRKKMEYKIDKDKLHKIYDQSPQKTNHKRVKYVASPRSVLDLSQKDFN